MNLNIEIDNDRLGKIIRKILYIESVNVKTNHQSSAQLVQEIKMIIKEEVNRI